MWFLHAIRSCAFQGTVYQLGAFRERLMTQIKSERRTILIVCREIETAEDYQHR